MKELNAWTGTGIDSAPLMLSENATSDQRLQRAEAEVRRLARCMEMKDRQLCELRKALAHSATVHYSFEDRLQRELDSLRIMMPTTDFRGHWDTPASEQSDEGFVVKLPYVTSILSVLFDAMYTFWAGCDHDHPPKSTTVAHAIDERLGLTSQSNGEASRSGQAYASAIRPDRVKEADNRHHGRSPGGR
ncbi:hypothetical protein DR64_8029 [Paraburkholderia xenovorans LB400]|uniref:Uncharacterized protein n=1 Tax=Paraburkholderia xenovorans (strain LB400) TaxID=266265 RepID=Q13HX1_PARXL|nr:hypothetical protein [Paraburkholderia xenovorans]ABE36318.1 Conserved hypothetical protein [Paraburkholderia xenovorans LB400]AIP35138.1 hypothetical protein DR64_8029 [Paraburkholderia xenovorans LB400]